MSSQIILFFLNEGNNLKYQKDISKKSIKKTE